MTLEWTDTCIVRQDGVRYVEVRFAPQLHAGEEPELLSQEAVIRAVNGGLQRAKEEINR
jgi:hypothetical protein